MNSFVDSQSVREYLLGLQQRIVGTFEQLDGKPFLRDAWEKPADAPLGGGGLTRIIEEGNLLERGGVGFSHVIGSKLPPSATAQRPELAGRSFEAMGVSLVFHPRNPHVPTVHMNVRFFIARKQPPLPGNGERVGRGAIAMASQPLLTLSPCRRRGNKRATCGGSVEGWISPPTTPPKTTPATSTPPASAHSNPLEKICIRASRSGATSTSI